MKVLMVNKYLYAKGGAETYFLKIGKYLEESGHKVQYFGMYDEKNSVSNDSSCYTMNMDFHSTGVKRLIYPFKIIYSREAKNKIGKVIKQFQPDIIHLNNINFQLTPSIIEEAYRQHIPIIQTVHDYQMLCPNHLMFDIHTMKPCELCVNHSPLNCEKKRCIHDSRAKSMIGALEAKLYRYKGTYQKVDRYISPSYFLEKKLLEVELFKDKTITIHNFIEQKEFDSSIKKEDYIVYFGRLSEEKGFEMFLNCCRRLPEIKVKIAGTGPLERLCDGISNVEFIGFKTGKELSELIQKALFSVYPSIWYENCPLSVLESESYGTPVLASAMGGIPELIEDGKTGVLVNPMEEDILYQAIKELYHDRDRLANMSVNCLNKRNAMISLEDYCKKLLKEYHDVIKNYGINVWETGNENCNDRT